MGSVAGRNYRVGSLRICLEAEDFGSISSRSQIPQGQGEVMDSTTIIRVVAGVLFVVVLAVMVWRRKSMA